MKQGVSEGSGSAIGLDGEYLLGENLELGEDSEGMEGVSSFFLSVDFSAEERDGSYLGKRQTQWEEVLKEG